MVNLIVALLVVVVLNDGESFLGIHAIISLIHEDGAKEEGEASEVEDARTGNFWFSFRSTFSFLITIDMSFFVLKNSRRIMFYKNCVFF